MVKDVHLHCFYLLFFSYFQETEQFKHVYSEPFIQLLIKQVKSDVILLANQTPTHVISGLFPPSPPVVCDIVFCLCAALFFSLAIFLPLCSLSWNLALPVSSRWHTDEWYGSLLTPAYIIVSAKPQTTRTRENIAFISHLTWFLLVPYRWVGPFTTAGDVTCSVWQLSKG